ncbi:hypothetical protein D3C87_1602880 [compost metagenome]
MPATAATMPAAVLKLIMASSLERRSGAFLAARRLCQFSLPAMASFIICTAALCSASGATTASTAPTLRASSAR